MRMVPHEYNVDGVIIGESPVHLLQPHTTLVD